MSTQIPSAQTPDVFTIAGKTFLKTSEPIPFVSPDDSPYSPYAQIVRGGAEIGDSSAGLDVQNWIASLEDGTVTISVPGKAPTFSLRLPTALAVSLAFDQNMGVVIAYQVPTGASLYFYSASLKAYTTLTVPNATSSRVYTDLRNDKDVLFAYTVGNALYYRELSEKFRTQHIVASTKKLLRRVGRTIDGHLQFELM